MISIGNDIVDLNYTDKVRTVEPRFYSKFITEPESLFFAHAAISHITIDQYIWLLWSVKESAYKFLKRIYPDLLFSPAKITVTKVYVPIISPKTNITGVFEPNLTSGIFHSGEVIYHDHTLFFRSIITDGLIATIVSQDKYLQRIYWEIERINTSGNLAQSRQVKELVIRKLNDLYPQNKFAIGKSSVGYPIIQRDGDAIEIPLSFAHHGHYISYCFTLE